MKLLVDPVLLLRKRGGLEERKQVYSGCSTFRGKQLRVSDQSQGWQSNQATKSQTHEEGFVKVKIMRLLVWGSQLLRHKPRLVDEQAPCHVTKLDSLPDSLALPTFILAQPVL